MLRFSTFITFLLHSWSSADAVFFISLVYVTLGTKQSSLFWDISVLVGLNRKNTRKNMKFWTLNPYYKRCDWKTWLSQTLFEALHGQYMLRKLTEIEQNWIMFIPPWLYQESSTDPFTGQPREIHGKKLSWQYHMSKFTRLNWSKTAKQFSVNSRGKFICQYQARRQEGKQAFGLYPLSSSLYFSEISYTFHFGQMFNGFRRSTLRFYWLLALQFSCITVRFSEDKFLFAVASD